MSGYCNLHTHTCYSILDGYGIPRKMVQRAIDLGQPALAITDHGSMSGLLETKKVCDELGISLLPGCELYMAPFGHDTYWRPDSGGRAGTSYHLTAWAYNQAGYRNLLKLNELSNKVGFYYVPRVDQYMLAQYNEGLVITSGCMASYACKALTVKEWEHGLTSKHYRKVNEYFDWAMDIFGRDRFYIELQDHDIPELREINAELAAINKHFNFEYLATNDSHYAAPEDASGQAETMAIGQGCTIVNPSSFVQGYIDHPDYFMTSYEQMAEKDYGFDVPDSAFTNTLVVADMLEKIYFGYEEEVKKYRFPIMPEYENDYDGHLRKIAWNGLHFRYGNGNRTVTDEVINRFDHEISIIESLGFASYFLCIYDINMFCTENSIPMTVRGSAGGSIILYCLGITDFCPLEYNLLFERFLNPDRVSAPDADLDIDPTRREAVVKYIVKKYGEDFVAQVMTFRFIKGRMAIRDAVRLLEHPASIAEAMISRMFDHPNVTVAKTVDEKSEMYVSGFITNKIEDEIFRLALRVEGQIRNTSIHAGAVMVSDRPLVLDYPMSKPRAAKEDKKNPNTKAITPLVVAVDYNTAEELGGIKIDVLGVSSLGILYRSMEMINGRYGTKYRFDNVPTDDPISYEVINSGRLSEIFQLTGHTARIVTNQIKPQNVEDVMAINALARPGPLQYAQLYADRMHGLEDVEYKHPDLAEVLAETQGVIIYQEQSMRISQVIGGFTGGEADTFRKAISKKKGVEIVLDKLKRQGVERGYDEKFINKLCDDLMEMGNYQFNASHACAYARIAVKLAYLKGKYPLEFYAAAMTGRVGDKDKLMGILSECRGYGIDIMPPKLGKSDTMLFTVDDEDNSIRFPFVGVKTVGKAGKYLVNIDLTSIEQVNADHLKWFKKAGKRPLEALALVGAFDHLFSDRNEALEAALYLSKGIAPVEQLTFIEDNKELYSYEYFLAAERELTGLYLTGHPLEKYDLKQAKFSDKETYEGMNDELGLFVGVINSIRLHRDRNGNLMAFVTIEDMDYNEMSIVVFSSLYDKIYDRICIGCVAKVLGKVSVKPEDDENAAKYGRVSIIAKNIIGA